MSDEKKAEQVFVIQQERRVTTLTDADGTVTGKAWVDIATVTIPANTPRRIALKKALEGVQVTEGEKLPRLRALDAKSAEVHEPKAVQPPVEWRL